VHQIVALEDICVDGQYLGRDCDPNVRFELRRGWTHD